MKCGTRHLDLGVPRLELCLDSDSEGGILDIEIEADTLLLCLDSDSEGGILNSLRVPVGPTALP